MSETTESTKVTFKRDLAPHRRASFRVCRTCGKMYILSDDSAIHFATTFGSLPLSCEVCRERAKNKTE